jgi:hypothetical protein
MRELELNGDAIKAKNKIPREDSKLFTEALLTTYDTEGKTEYAYSKSDFVEICVALDWIKEYKKVLNNMNKSDKCRIQMNQKSSMKERIG